jgi:hypothetical protein
MKKEELRDSKAPVKTNWEDEDVSWGEDDQGTEFMLSCEHGSVWALVGSGDQFSIVECVKLGDDCSQVMTRDAWFTPEEDRIYQGLTDFHNFALSDIPGRFS